MWGLDAQQRPQPQQIYYHESEKMAMDFAKKRKTDSAFAWKITLSADHI